jgi:hypothetical protein
MSYKPGTIEIQWSIHAMTRGIGGITAAHHTTGSAREATDAMIEWLQSRDIVESVPPVVEVWAQLTSEQALEGSHRMTGLVQGLPAERCVAYSVDWLRLVARVENWGGGR